ncbi:MlaD family protein [Aminiphilus circumscriptus]|jgi:phospholipid/cholesterol/gamma-HCH transport system substrate-binding protein|uniref:MlaD family protein n=1 Tax=Aminiphilus circumscriptus TaxID=290732 RepID=UPI00049274E3|nr:MlaD family protein [Aminiphilus circumscriptus]
MERELKAGLLVFSALVLFGALVFVTGGALFGRKGYSFSVLFPDAGGLQVGAPVFVSGVELGQVQALRLTPEGVFVVVSLPPEVAIPEDSVFSIGKSGLLGDASIKVVRGGAERMVSSDETVTGHLPPSFEEALEEIRGDFLEVRRTFAYINDILGDSERRSAMKDMLDALPELVEEGRTTFGTIGDAAQDARHFLSRAEEELQDVSGKLSVLLENVDASVRENKDVFAETLRHIRNVATQLDDVLRDFNEDSLSGKDLRRAVTKLGDAASQVEQLALRVEEELFASEGTASLPEVVREVRQTVSRAQDIIHEVESVRTEGQVSLHSAVSGKTDAEESLLLDASIWIGKRDFPYGILLGVENVGLQDGLTLAPTYDLPWGRVWAGIVRGYVGLGFLWQGSGSSPFSLQGQWWNEDGGFWAAEGRIRVNERSGFLFKHEEQNPESRQSVGVYYRF